jgi:hypothetical protein
VGTAKHCGIYKKAKNQLHGMMHMQLNDELFDFLLQASKQFRSEEFFDCDTQSITKLFDCGDSCAVIPAADNVVYGRLCNTANAAQLVNCDIAFLA